MGKSTRSKIFRLHGFLFAIREYSGQTVSQPIGHRRAERFARELLGTGEMGSQTAYAQEPKSDFVAENEYGHRPWRQQRQVRSTERSGVAIRFCDRDAARQSRQGECTFCHANAIGMAPSSRALWPVGFSG